jgi:MFS family permease
MQPNSPCKPYFVVFAAALFYLFEFINMNSFNALNDQLRDAFQVNALQISNLSAMYFYANVIFMIPAGLLLDRVSTKKLLVSALSLCILSALVFANTHSFMVACVCRFITGMGSTLVLLSCAVLTSRWIKPIKAGLVLGGAVTLAMFGGMLAQQITCLVDWTGSWRTAVACIAGLGAVFLVMILWLVEDYPVGYQETFKNDLDLIHQGFWRNFALALKNKQIWFAGLYASLINLTIMIIGALWGKDYLMTTHDFNATNAATAISAVFLGFMVGSPLFGMISDRLRQRKLPMIIGGVLNLFWVLLILHFPFSSMMAGLIFFMLGLLCASQVLVFPLIIESVPMHITASSEAISAAVIMGGGAVSQPLFGWLLDHSAQIPGQYSASDFNHAMWMLPIAFFIAIICSLCLKETHCKTFNKDHS